MRNAIHWRYAVRSSPFPEIDNALAKMPVLTVKPGIIVMSVEYAIAKNITLIIRIVCYLQEEDLNNGYCL